MDGELIDLTFGVDAKAGALLIAQFSRRYLDRGATWGRMVALTSGGTGGFPGEVTYGAAKAALESYILSASRELSKKGITANVLYPPVTDTGWATTPSGSLSNSTKITFTWRSRATLQR